jgi:hypothetical protein
MTGSGPGVRSKRRKHGGGSDMADGSLLDLGGRVPISGQASAALRSAMANKTDELSLKGIFDRWMPLIGEPDLVCFRDFCRLPAEPEIM